MSSLAKADATELKKILSNLTYFYNSVTTPIITDPLFIFESDPKTTKTVLENRLTSKYPILKHKVLTNTEIQTYIQLKSLFKDTKHVTDIRDILADLYNNHILGKTLTSINEALEDKNICGKINELKPGITGAQIEQYARNLGIPITPNTPKNFICFMILADITSSISNKYLRVIRKSLNPKRSMGPTGPSKLTPQQIADKFKQKRGFRGPVNGYTLVPKNSFHGLLERTPPVFVLLGDIHEAGPSVSVKRLATDPTLLSLRRRDPTLYQELSNLARTENLNVDLFLESWQSQSNRNKNSETLIAETETNSTIRESKAMMMQCYGNRKDKQHETCIFPEFRTHPADPRYIDDENDKRPLDGIVQLVEDLFKSAKPKNTDDIKKIMESLRTKAEAAFKREGEEAVNIIKILQELKGLCTPDIKDGLNHFFTSPFFEKYSRTRHQFEQLPKAIGTKIQKKMESVYSFMKCGENQDGSFGMLLNKMLDYYNCIPTIKGTCPKDINSTLKNIYILAMQNNWATSFGGILIDLYSVCRALKIPKGSQPSELSVLYQGSNHVHRIMDLLSDFYDVEQQWGRYTNYTQSYTTKYEDIFSYTSRDITQNDMWNPFEYKIKSGENLHVDLIWKTDFQQCGALVSIYIIIAKIKKDTSLSLEEKNKKIIEFLEKSNICNTVKNLEKKDTTLNELGYDIPKYYPEVFKCYAIMSNILEQVVKTELDKLYLQIKQLGKNSNSSQKNALLLKANLCKYFINKNGIQMTPQEIKNVAASMGFSESEQNDTNSVCYVILGRIFHPLDELQAQQKRKEEALAEEQKQQQAPLQQALFKNSNPDKPYLDEREDIVKQIAELDPPIPIQTDILYSLKTTGGIPVTPADISNLQKNKGWCLNVPNLFRDSNQGVNSLEMEYTMVPAVDSEQVSMRYTINSSELPKLTSLLQQINEHTLPSTLMNTCTNQPYYTQTKTVFQVPNSFVTYIMTESHCVLAE